MTNLPKEGPPLAPSLTENDSDGDAFEREVERCRKGKLRDVIENTSAEHAAILMKNLLIFSSDNNTDVKIVSGSLHPKFYDALVYDIQSIMNKGQKVKIVILSDESSIRQNIFYNAVKRHDNGSVICLPDEKDIQHFILTDNAYRVEVDDQLKKAYASFNDEDHVMTGILAAKFSDLWNLGEGDRNVQRGLVGAG